jgi:hypothetical protein
MTDTHETNPYRSPDEPSLTAKSPPRRTRWRIIPVVLLGIYGTGVTVMSAAAAFIAASWFFGCKAFINPRPGGPLAEHPVVIFCGAMEGMIVGTMILMAARCFWNVRWRRGLLWLVVAGGLIGMTLFADFLCDRFLSVHFL